MLKSCECGCGQPVKNRFVSTHNLRVQPHFQTPATRKMHSDRMKINNPMKNPEIAKRQHSIRMKNGWDATKWSKECNDVIRELRKKGLLKLYVEYPENKERLRKQSSERMKSSNPMKNEKSLLKMLDTQAKKGSVFTIPNQQEIWLDEFLEEHFPGQWNFVGNWSFWIGKHNPDFLHTKEKKVIELFGDYWHKDDNPQDWIDHYKKHGYDCLVIWEKELNGNLFERIHDYIGGDYA